MTPLDLAKAPPRSPQAELRGLCMLPRMIDIARAKLPGGNVGDYQIGRDKTLSAAVLDGFGISAGQFVNIVRDARTDEDVAEHLWVAGNARPKALTARLRRVTVADIAADRRPDFERLYGTNHPADQFVFDVLEADDAQAFPPPT